MTREEALRIDNILVHIEAYEALLDELYSLDTVQELKNGFVDDKDLEEQIVQVVQCRLDKLLEELNNLKSPFEN